MRLLMRPTNGSLVPAVRAIVRELDENLPIVRAATLADLAAYTLFPQRVAAWLATAVGIIGVFLAALGAYGLTSYSVSQRRREIGIRLALGAVRGHVLRMVVARALMLATVGTTLGLVAAALVMGLLEGMLYDVRPLDARVFHGWRGRLSRVCAGREPGPCAPGRQRRSGGDAAIGMTGLRSADVSPRGDDEQPATLDR